MAETINVIIKGRNLEGLRRALAKNAVRCLRNVDWNMSALPRKGEPIIESITLAPDAGKDP